MGWPRRTSFGRVRLKSPEDTELASAIKVAPSNAETVTPEIGSSFRVSTSRVMTAPCSVRGLRIHAEEMSPAEIRPSKTTAPTTAACAFPLPVISHYHTELGYQSQPFFALELTFVSLIG